MKSLTLSVFVSTSDNRLWLIMMVMMKHNTAKAEDSESNIRNGIFLIEFSMRYQRRNVLIK
jgi:hypothetical protein